MGLSDEQVDDAAAILLHGWTGRPSSPDLPDELTPATTIDIQRIIDAVNAKLPMARRGWKIFSVYKPMSPPIVSPLYRIFENGALLPAALSSLRIVEPEIMFRAERTLPPRERRYGIDEIREAVTAFVGLEVIASRFSTDDLGEADKRWLRPKSAFSSLADNMSHSALVTGDDIPDWRNVDFDTVRVRLTEDGTELASVVGGHPMDDPFLSIVMGVNRLRDRGGLRAGDVLVTSASTGYHSVAAGRRIRAVYEGLGEVSACFEGEAH